MWVRCRQEGEQPGGGRGRGSRKAERDLGPDGCRGHGGCPFSLPHILFSLYPLFSACIPSLSPSFGSHCHPFFSSKSQLFHLPNKGIRAGDCRPPVLLLLLSLQLLKSDSIRAAASGLWMFPRLAVKAKGPDLGFPASACVPAVMEQACFTSHSGWRWARVPNLETAFLPQSNGFLSAPVPLR